MQLSLFSDNKQPEKEFRVLWDDWLAVAKSVNREKAERVERIVETVRCSKKTLHDNLVDTILKIAPRDFLSSCFLLNSSPSKTVSHPIPEQLREIVLLECDGVGQGEIALLFFSDNSRWSPGQAVDVHLHGIGWHVKKITNKNKRARMGKATKTSYLTSSTAHKLASVNLAFASEFSKVKAQAFEKEISSVFGSVRECWSVLEEEFYRREFSDAAGVCFVNTDENTLEFCLAKDVELVGATQGSYRIKQKNKQKKKKVLV